MEGGDVEFAGVVDFADVWKMLRMMALVVSSLVGCRNDKVLLAGLPAELYRFCIFVVRYCVLLL